MILPEFLYACETLSLTLREKHRLRVYDNRVLRRLSGPERDEIIENCRKLLNEELHNLHSSPNVFRKMKSRNVRWVGHVARVGRREMHIRFWWESQMEIDR
jgi:hypothetical protein